MLRGHQRPSEVLRGHQGLTCTCREAIRGHQEVLKGHQGLTCTCREAAPPWKALRDGLLLPSLGLPPPPPPPKSGGILAAPATPATALAEVRGSPAVSRGRKATLRMPSRKSHLMRSAIGAQHAMREAISGHQRTRCGDGF